MKSWILLLFVPAALLADSEVVPVAPELEWEEPWFTGPLLASSPTVIPVGHFNVEPYVTYLNNPARYGNDWEVNSYQTMQQVNFEPYFWIGLTNWADLQLAPAWSYNYRDGPAHWVLNDWSAKLDLQLHLDQLPHKSWWPSIKLGIQETFPTGKYQHLNPAANYSDQGGAGSWVTTIQLAFGKILHIKGSHWLQSRLNLNYSIWSKVHVEGLSAYGGGYGTNGTVKPGQQFSFDASFEFSLTRHWVIACDFAGNYQQQGKFSGDPGHHEDGTPATNTLRTSIQYSMAPAIEYNWNDSIGIIAGSWFTLAGKNSTKFSTAMIALNYYYQ